MNYKSLIKKELDGFANEFTEYSFGEVLYSILTELNLRSKSQLIPTKEGKAEITDELIYEAIVRAIIKEREDI